MGVWVGKLSWEEMCMHEAEVKDKYQTANEQTSTKMGVDKIENRRKLKLSPVNETSSVCTLAL